MKRIANAYWAELRNNFPAELLTALANQLATSDPVVLTVDGFGAEVDSTPAEIKELLDRLAADDYLTAKETRPCPRCHEQLSDGDLAKRQCSSCHYVLEEGTTVTPVTVYVREGQQARDVRWVITVHGMNTPGIWQQDFSWRLAKLYGYAVPVGIYKYGNIKLSPFIPFRQKHHRDRLLQYMRKLRDEMRAEKYGDRPDIIAHSFGTWLLAHAMLADTSDDPLKLGRVILTGSIVQPDFQWKQLLDSGRIEALLCHYAGRDVPVRIAQFTIPDSGPSGRYGFNDQVNVLHKFEPAFGHSDYFIEANLDRVMREKWAPFLTLPLPELTHWRDAPNALATTPWAASRWRCLTSAGKALILTLLLFLLILSSFALAIGFPKIVRWVGF